MIGVAIMVSQHGAATHQEIVDPTFSYFRTVFSFVLLERSKASALKPRSTEYDAGKAMQCRRHANVRIFDSDFGLRKIAIHSFIHRI